MLSWDVTRSAVAWPQAAAGPRLTCRTRRRRFCGCRGTRRRPEWVPAMAAAGNPPAITMRHRMLCPGGMWNLYAGPSERPAALPGTRRVPVPAGSRPYRYR